MIIILKSFQLFQRKICMFLNQQVAFSDSVELNEGVLACIHTGCFAQFFSITDHIQHIVTNLKSQS